MLREEGEEVDLDHQEVVEEVGLYTLEVVEAAVLLVIAEVVVVEALHVMEGVVVAEALHVMEEAVVEVVLYLTRVWVVAAAAAGEVELELQAWEEVVEHYYKEEVVVEVVL